MTHHPRSRRRRPAASFLLLLALPLAARAADPPAATPPAETLDLGACISLALQRQPRIAAARASLAAAEDGKRALDNLHVPAIIDPEIPVRRRQASLGVAAAVAGLEQAEHEAVYAVTRTYYTVVYAREQERVARAVVDRLSAVSETARKQLGGDARNVTTADVDRTEVYVGLARTQQIKAAEGIRRALAALREAIGTGPECRIDVPAGRLPEPDARVNGEEILAGALARRGEMAQAAIFAEETCLEVEAQASGVHKRMETFAAGGDIHSRQVPPGEHNDDYRPGAVPPEMPTVLAGNRPDRVRHAQSLHARAGAAAEVTRNLIALEAEEAYLRWEEASREVAAARSAADTGDRLAADLNKDFTTAQKVRVEDVVNAHVLASQARSRYNEFLYREILALADLERVTGGAFCAGLVGSAAPRARTEPAAGDKKTTPTPSDKDLFNPSR